MKFKKTASLFLALLLLIMTFSQNIFAAEEKLDISEAELPKPAAPKYMMFDAADRTATEGSDSLYILAVFDKSVIDMASEYDTDSDAFCEKYGLYDFEIGVQLDSSLDGTNAWNHTEEWDSYYGGTGTENAAAYCSIRSDMFENITLFDLYAKISYEDNFGDIEDAIIRRDVPDGDSIFTNYYFDHENHSPSVRMRYYMYWETYDGETVGDGQSKVSEWSDIAVFGKGGNYVTPDEPTGYEAPIISELKYAPPTGESELGRLTYIQTTPEQAWNAGIYYKMTENGDFEGLETEISLDGGDWVEYITVDAWGDWCLYNGERTAYNEEPRIEADSNIKLRVRFLGTHGPSEWSNVLELSGGGTQEAPEDTGGKPDSKPVTDKEEKCSLCGFCPVPFGLCIFIWIAIILAVIVLAVIITLAVKPKRCKSCGEKMKKGEKQCPKCGAAYH